MTKRPGLAPPLIALFLPALSAGGAERVMLAVAGEIARRGYRCDVVTAYPGGRWWDRIPSGVRHVPLERDKPLHATPRLVRYLQKEEPHVLLASVLSANIAAVLATRFTRTRCVLREAYRAEDDSRSPSAVTELGNRAALRWLYRRADAVVALTSGLAEHIIGITHIDPSKVYVIPNPHLPSLDTPAATRDATLVLACGRLEAQKDFATLLRAFSLVRNARSTRLVVLGEGSQLEMLRQLSVDLAIEKDVEFAGYTDNVQGWMGRAKVFVLTSRVEGFPNVLLEALANGCAVVSTNSSDAVAEILDEGRWGTIVPVGDISGVANGILAAMSWDNIENELPPLAKYDLSTIVDQYLEVFAIPVPNTTKRCAEEPRIKATT